MSDIRKLIEAVEGGDDGGNTAAFINNRIASRYHDKGGYWPSNDVMKAYDGSLDAAHWLHEALLPGWTRDVDATAPECGVTVTLHKPYSPHRSPDDMGVVSSDMPCEARAWLLAILKAYEAQQ